MKQQEEEEEEEEQQQQQEAEGDRSTDDTCEIWTALPSSFY